MKILVTGGAGYIGAHSVVELISAGYDPVVVDNLSASDLTLIQGIEKITGKQVVFYQGDCRDRLFLSDVFAKENISAVIHFAALKSVGESVEKPLEYYDNNVGSLLVLLDAIRRHRVTDFIFSSSCTVYGQPDSIPVTEETPFKRPSRLMERPSRCASAYWKMWRKQVCV